MRGAGLAVALAGLLLSAPAMAQQDDLETQRSRLEQLQQEIAEKRAEAARLERTASSVLDELEALERERGVTRSLIRNLESEIEHRTIQIEETTRDLARVQDEMVIKRQMLARRLRTIYKVGKYGDFEVLLMARSFPEILGRYRYLRLVADQDRRLLDRISRLEREVRRNRAGLEIARETLTRARAERLEQERALSRSEGERQRILQRVKSERSQRLEAAEALEEEKRKIQAVLATLERRRAEREALARREAEAAGRAVPVPEASTLTGEFGELDWPVEGEIIERFGRSTHPVYNTEVINNGIDIRAPRGTPVRTVAAGEVVYADWNGGYGLMVIVHHGDGHYSLYGHLDRALVAVGQRVARDDPVGTVGETGSLVGAKLHFEIREGRRAVDPIEWLKRR